MITRRPIKENVFVYFLGKCLYQDDDRTILRNDSLICMQTIFSRTLHAHLQAIKYTAKRFTK